MTEKRILGQYYTINNPFSHELINKWVSSIPDINKAIFVEPFAGSNNLIHLFNKSYPHIKTSQWSAYDIAPEAVDTNKVPEVKLIKQDTILQPVKANVTVTNPPYIAKNSATKNKFSIDFGDHQNLYEVAVEKMLTNSDFLCAIIPESFITRNIFRERLTGVISVTENLFDDTGIPVCVALWGKEKTDDYEIYSGDHKLGWNNELKQKLANLFPEKIPHLKVVFNDPHGLLGVKAIDNTKTASMEFVRGETILPEKIKHTSRHITRVTVYDRKSNQLAITEENLDSVIIVLNNLLEAYRKTTEDVFLTSTKGIRADGKYRRRLDFKTITLFINNAITEN